jgi:hypothetical protein
MYKEDIFAFLDNVRESGKINMFGAAPVLQEVFGLDRRDARDMLLEWMDTFAERNKVANGN